MDKRYQVFVSSTYIDLIPERSEVMQALLELKCMPAGMELFPAANETQWNWIKKVIDESDYYVVIVAGRYGTISKDTGQSYTEMEYRYALESGKPVIGFLHEDISKIQSKSVEQSASMRKKLDAFRQLVGSKLCKFYSSPSDLGAKVSRSLTQLKENYPATGWIRADAMPSSATLDEILKLKEENERLNERIYQLGIQKPNSTEHLASGRENFEIEFQFRRRAVNPDTGYYRNNGMASDSVSISWDEMFSVIGPDLALNRGYGSIHGSIRQIVETKTYPELQKKYPEEKFDDFRIAEESIDTIAFQFRALKLITTDKEGDWQLTPYGENYMAKLLAVPKGKTRREI